MWQNEQWVPPPFFSPLSLWECLCNPWIGTKQSTFSKYSKPFKGGTQKQLHLKGGGGEKATVPLMPSWSWDIIKLTYWFLWIYKCLFHKLHLQSLGIFRALSFPPPSKWINYVPHVILLPVKSMHTSPICCSSQADKLALCTHKQTEYFPDIKDCFQREKQSPGPFMGEKRKKEKQTQKTATSIAFSFPSEQPHCIIWYNRCSVQKIVHKSIWLLETGEPSIRVWVSPPAPPKKVLNASF